MFFNFAQNSQKKPAFNWKYSKLIIYYIKCQSFKAVHAIIMAPAKTGKEKDR